jgi:hypothetical protein
MKLFNFFLVLSGLILGAFPAVRSLAPAARLTALLPLLLVLTAFIFWRLEQRTRQLVKNGENALRFLDEQWSLTAEGGEPHPLAIVARDDYLVERIKKRWWAKCGVPVTYAGSFRIAYVMIGAVGLVLALWTALFQSSSTCCLWE